MNACLSYQLSTASHIKTRLPTIQASVCLEICFLPTLSHCFHSFTSVLISPQYCDLLVQVFFLKPAQVRCQVRVSDPVFQISKASRVLTSLYYGQISDHNVAL